MFKSADLSTFADNERDQYFEDMHTKEDIERMIDYAKNEGIEIGMERGMEKGKEIGREEAKHESIEFMAKKMLKMGMEIETISSVTGMSPEQIRSL